MIGVILSAGKSTRTYPLTLTRPKPLLTIAGKPIIERNISALSSSVDSIIIVIGYKGDMIIDKIGYEYLGIPIKYVWQEEQNGTGGALKLVENFVDNDFIVIMGDDIYSSDDVKLIVKNYPSVLLHKVEDVSRFGVVEVEDGFVKSIVEKPNGRSRGLANTAMYHFDRRVFDILRSLAVSKRGEYELPQVMLMGGYEGKVRAIAGTGEWRPIGYPWDYLMANIDESKEDSGSFINKEAVVSPEAIVVSSVVMRGARIGRGASILYSVIGENVVVGNGVRISDISADGGTVKSVVKGEVVDTGLYNLGAIIGDGAMIGEEAMITAGIKIWPGVIIPPGVVLSDDIIV